MDTEIFFGYHIDPVSLAGKGMLLAIAVVLSGLVGLEREWRGNPAGMRTHILVCLGSTVITMTSVEIGMGVRGGLRGDPGHIAAQIVSGIGFLGAGAILREGANVRGLTTAASIWAMAGIGIALGASPRLAELAVLATLIVLATLTVLTRIESALKLRQQVCNLEIEMRDLEGETGRVLDLLYQMEITIFGAYSETGDILSNKSVMNTTRQMRLRVLLPPKFNRAAFNRTLLNDKGIISFHME